MAKKPSGSLASLSDSIKKEYGDILLDGDMLAETEGRIIPTTLGLDIALSGGIPEGVVMNVGGVPKSGKTTLCLHIIAQAQRLYKKKCYYIDVEGRLRTDLLKCIKGLVYTKEQEAETGIPCLSIIRSSKNNFLTAEKFIDIITKILKDEDNVIVVLDSVAAMCTDDSFSKTAAEGKRRAGVPSLMYEFLRQAAQILPTQQSNLFLITHLQQSQGPYGGMKEAGGDGMKYFGSVILKCVSAPEVPAQSTPKIGKDTAFKVTASALGPPSGEAVIFIRYGKGCDTEEDLVHVGEELGFINKSGAWYSFEKNGEPEKFQGKQAIVDHLKANPEDFELLNSAIRKLVFPE